MIYSVLYIVVLIYAIISYIQKKYVAFIISIFLLLSNFLRIIPSGQLRPVDIELLICVPLLFYCYLIDRSIFNTRKDKIGKIIKFLIVYYFICIILSVIRGKESFGYGLLLFRFEIFQLSYFIFKRIDMQSLQKAFKYIIYLNIFGGILYYLQFLGVTNILMTNTEITTDGGGIQRFTNSPYLTIPILLYLFFSNTYIKHRLILIFFYLGLFVLPMGRGALIATVAVSLFYLFAKKRIRLKQLVVIGLAFCIFQPIISYRFSEKGSTGSGVINEMKESARLLTERNFSGYNSQSLIYNDGTFAFRMTMVAERINYLSESFIRLLIGEGTIHESSNSIKRYNFNVGTLITEGGALHMQQIDTNDVAFISHIFRYGFIYLMIYAAFLILTLKKLYKVDHPFAVCAFLYLTSLVVRSLGTDQFSTLQGMFFILLVLGIMNNGSTNMETEKQISRSI